MDAPIALSGGLAADTTFTGTGGDGPALAAALLHLLRRGDHPARWTSSRFAAAVDASRSQTMVPTPSAGWPGDGTLASLAGRLATDPIVVATAIHHIEASRGRLLPRWLELLRPGAAASPSDVEIGTWFG